MRRFWYEDLHKDTQEITLEGDLFHHINDVCRMRVGDRFELVGKALACAVEVVNSTKHTLQVKVVGERPLPSLVRPHIHLAISVPRPSKVDWIVEKAVELGVKSIHLFVSDYSFFRELKEIKGNRLDRWHKIIRQACQQSGRGELLDLPEPTTLKNLIGQINPSTEVLGLFLYEGECRRTLKQFLRQTEPGKVQDCWVFIGSEGGFSSSEVAQLQEARFEPLSLGNLILRVETACLAVASVLKYEFEVLDEGRKT